MIIKIIHCIFFIGLTAEPLGRLSAVQPEQLPAEPVGASRHRRPALGPVGRAVDDEPVGAARRLRRCVTRNRPYQAGLRGRERERVQSRGCTEQRKKKKTAFLECILLECIFKIHFYKTGTETLG